MFLFVLCYKKKIFYYLKLCSPVQNPLKIGKPNQLVNIANFDLRAKKKVSIITIEFDQSAIKLWLHIPSEHNIQKAEKAGKVYLKYLKLNNRKY